MEENNKGGYTAEGRKLRPRRPRISSESRGSNFSERTHSRNYGEQEGGRRASTNRGDRRSYSERGERRSYGGERSDYGSSDRRNNYEHRSYGERNNRSEERNYGERRSFGENKGSYTERRERRSFGENRGNSGRRSFGSGDRNRRPQSSRIGSGRNFGFKRQGGFQKNPYQFGKSSEEGINKMISRRPQVDKMQHEYSDFDSAPTGFREEVRLNKYIANSGICSRREADQFIQAGVVSVNGEIVTELGTKVNVLKDEVKFNDELVKGEKKLYIVMNKPKGFVTTTSDSHADKTVMDLLKGLKTRVFPVGRLDKSTTGVLMFTNDGEIAEKLTHPSYDKKKIYQVILDKPINDEDFAKIVSGIELNDGPVKADELEYIDSEDHRKLGIEIHSGKNRIVRRIFESLGYEVKALDRVYFAGLTKKGLKKGEWRILTEGEANVLKMGAYV